MGSTPPLPCAYVTLAISLTTSGDPPGAHTWRDTAASLPPLRLRSGWNIENAARMQAFPVVRPLAAQLGLSGPAVRSFSTVQGAIRALIVQEPARGDHLRFERILSLPANLTQIGRLSRADQRLKGGLVAVAEDLNLEITAAGGAASMIGGGTGGNRAGIGAIRLLVHHREAAWRKRQALGHQLVALDDQEAIAAELAWLIGPAGLGRQGTREPMNRASSPNVLPLFQVPAADMKCGVHEKGDTLATKIPKTDTVRVTEQPGRLVVDGVGSLLQSPDPERDRHLLAVVAEGGTGWGLMHVLI